MKLSRLSTNISNYKRIQLKNNYNENFVHSSFALGWPINFLFFDMATGESHFIYYNNGAISLESKVIFSDRKYDNAGFLQSQTITRKSIKPLKPDEVIQAKYEYIQL